MCQGSAFRVSGSGLRIQDLGVQGLAWEGHFQGLIEDDCRVSFGQIKDDAARD